MRREQQQMRRAKLQPRQQPPPAQPRRPCHQLAMLVLQQRPLSLLVARPCLQATRPSLLRLLSLLRPQCLLCLLRAPPLQRQQQEARLQVQLGQRRRRRPVRSRLHRPSCKSARRSGNGWAAGGADFNRVGWGFPTHFKLTLTTSLSFFG